MTQAASWAIHSSINPSMSCLLAVIRRNALQIAGDCAAHRWPNLAAAAAGVIGSQVGTFAVAAGELSQRAYLVSSARANWLRRSLRTCGLSLTAPPPRRRPRADVQRALRAFETPDGVRLRRVDWLVTAMRR